MRSQDRCTRWRLKFKERKEQEFALGHAFFFRVTGLIFLTSIAANLSKAISTQGERERATDIQNSVPGEKSAAGLTKRFARLPDRIVFSGLLGLIVLTVVPYGMVDAWWESVFECIVFALTAVWLVEVLRSGRWEVKRLFVLVPLVLITAYAFAQAVQLPGWLTAGNGQGAARHTLSIDQYQTYLTARKSLALTLFLGLLLLHTSSPTRLRWLVRVVVAVGLGSGLFGIIRQLLQSPESPAGFVLPFLFYGVGYGQFISHNVYAYLMEMTFALQAGLILGGGVRRDRIPIHLVISVLIWTALVLSNSRGGILGLTCQSIFLLFVSLTWYSERRLSRADGWQHTWLGVVQNSMLVRAVFMILIVGALITGVLWMGGERLASKLGEQATDQEIIDGSTRKAIWGSTWELIKHHPVTGVGFGAYFLAIPEYQAGSGRTKVEQAHSDYLELAAGGGVVAVGLAGWFVAMIVWRARASLRSGDAYRRAACLGAVAGILSIGVHSLVDFALQVTGIAVTFGALIVIAIADARVESTAHKRKG